MFNAALLSFTKEPVIPELFDKTWTPISEGIAFQMVKMPEEQVSEGGVEIPQTGDDLRETPQGLVVAVGPDVKQVKRGDIILVGGRTPLYRVRYRGQMTYIVTESNIFGVVDKLDGCDEDGCGKSCSTKSD